MGYVENAVLGVLEIRTAENLYVITLF